mmetsp:Transcript_11602/g.31066  ORF Transcript_11602/g.31066 Transcript_11602/m.31066 type:complete len:164 (-) Transcript_11602:144-635(-)
MSCVENLSGHLSPALQCSTKKEVPTGHLGSFRMVGLYFSASYCPPCREFTKILVDAYRRIKEIHGDDAMEIVLLPLDKCESDWTRYIESMPWTTLPFQPKEQIIRLFLKFSANRIPRLVIIEPSGKVICNDARGGTGFGFGCDPLEAYSHFMELQKRPEPETQ